MMWFAFWMSTVALDSMLVFIPAAGRGSRIGTGCLPKPLQSLGDKPLVARVMTLCQPGTRFVVALGYEKEKIRPVIDLIASQGNFHVDFVHTSSFEEGSLGLTQTLIDSRHMLQEPFVFHAVDSIFASLPKAQNVSGQNSVCFASPSTPAQFRTISTKVGSEPASPWTRWKAAMSVLQASIIL